MEEKKVRHYEISARLKLYDEYSASTYIPRRDPRRCPETMKLM